jgi:dTDP-4-dehydrorhamnose 3,5-epimerase-like enzyme
MAEPKESGMTDYLEDSRGWIRKFDIGGVKFNVLFTKAGVLRSGDYHSNTQYDLILEGSFKVTQKLNEQDVSEVYGPNALIKIPPKVPHLFEALADTTMLEWWDGPFNVEYYAPYRKLVEAAMKK